MTATQTVYLNQTEYRVPPVIHAVQNDTGRKVKMVIQDQVLPSGSTATLEIFRSDKSHYSVTCETFVSADNSFTAEIDQALTQAGPTECQLKVSGIVSTFTFIIDVQPDVSGISVPQDGYSVSQIIDLMDSKGITEDIKQALLACFANVAWIDTDGQDYYNALYNALYPPKTLVSIYCVYTQSGTVYDYDSIESLRSDLVVTAVFEDSTHQTVTNYVLSGTLESGESTITVTYGGKTTTFDVLVAGLATLTATYTQSGPVYNTDSLDSLKDDLVVTATYDDASTQTVTDYTLSGTLAVGTSTITVSYDEKTTTFTVTVTLEPPYTFYDYIQGDGTAYINTGLLASTYCTNSYDQEIKVAGYTTESSKAVCGARQQWGSTNSRITWHTNATYAQVYCGKDSGYVMSGSSLDVPVTIKTTRDKGIYCDGTLVDTGTGSVSITHTGVITLFAECSSGQGSGYVAIAGTNAYAGAFAKCRIYHFKVWDSNGDLVSYIRPALRKSDSAIGMYDSVRDIFLENARGSGAFSLGNE